jgi:hypothetical protein
MKKHGNCSQRPEEQILAAPAQPFTGIDLYGDLRGRLSAAAGRPVRLRELAQIMGRSKSTTHFWFSEYRHPQVLGLIALLERLSPEDRESFLASYCRQFPTLADENLSGATDELKKLLHQKTGLTLITGSTDAARLFVMTGFAHSQSSLTGLRPTGIDIHRPKTWVPIIGVRYIDEKLAAGKIRALVASVWPRILTSGAELGLFNGLLPIVPETLDDLLRMAAKRHVILAEQCLPDVSTRRAGISAPVHVVTLANGAHMGDIEIKCRAASAAARNDAARSRSATGDQK